MAPSEAELSPARWRVSLYSVEPWTCPTASTEDRKGGQRQFTLGEAGSLKVQRRREALGPRFWLPDISCPDSLTPSL